jgi:hypothetical protein
VPGSVRLVLVKNAVLTYFSVLALCGLVTLSVMGADLLQEKDPRGFAVLALVVGGLLLTLIFGVTHGAKSKPHTDSAKAPAFKSFTSTATAEYPHSTATVWALIRPAEAAVLLGDNVVQAVSVPGVTGGPGERQCFFLRNGQIDILEVIEELPGRLAVTQALFPPSPVSQKTTYRLDDTSVGCRLTMEAYVEVPEYLSIDQQAVRDHIHSTVSRVGELLDARVAEDATPGM